MFIAMYLSILLVSILIAYLNSKKINEFNKKSSGLKFSLIYIFRNYLVKGIFTFIGLMSFVNLVVLYYYIISNKQLTGFLWVMLRYFISNDNYRPINWDSFRHSEAGFEATAGFTMASLFVGIAFLCLSRMMTKRTNEDIEKMKSSIDVELIQKKQEEVINNYNSTLSRNLLPANLWFGLSILYFIFKNWQHPPLITENDWVIIFMPFFILMIFAMTKTHRSRKSRSNNKLD